MWRLTYLLLYLTSLAVLSVARPQSDPVNDNSLKEDNARVAIMEVVEEQPKIDYTKLGDPNYCGYSSKQLGRVSTTGGQATRRDYPWMITLLKKQDSFHFCGGVLITRSHVLTAAHCLHNLEKEKLTVRLGEYDFSRENDTETLDRDIAEVRVHDDWDVSTYENDIAILKLSQPVPYSIYVMPICLPGSAGEDYTNTTAVVAGWGTTSYGGPMSDVLLEVAVPVWEHERCTNSFTQTIFKTVQCAASYEGGKDSCQGDSGGPLMSQRDDGRWITIGVVSWGVRCAERGKPGVYTRVSNFLDWIAAQSQDLS